MASHLPPGNKIRAVTDMSDRTLHSPPGVSFAILAKTVPPPDTRLHVSSEHESDA